MKLHCKINVQKISIRVNRGLDMLYTTNAASKLFEADGYHVAPTIIPPAIQTLEQVVIIIISDTSYDDD